MRIAAIILIVLTIIPACFSSAFASQTPNFMLNFSPNALMIPPGTSGTSTLTVTSNNDFSNTVTLSATSQPNGPRVSLSASGVAVPADGSGISTVTIAIFVTVPPGVYTIRIAGTSGSFSESAILTVLVCACPGFTVAANPTFLVLPVRSSGNLTIILTSINGFYGFFNVTATVAPSGPTISLNPASVEVSPDSSSIIVLTAFGLREGTYIITVTGKAGVITNTLTVPVSIVDHHQGRPFRPQRSANETAGTLRAREKNRMNLSF